MISLVVRMVASRKNTPSQMGKIAWYKTGIYIKFTSTASKWMIS